MQTFISTLTLEFSVPCRPHEIKQFRGVFAELGGWDNSLFHQHDNSNEEGKLIHRYPLIQYRSYKDRPYIYAINEGRDALMELWKSGAIEKYYMKKGVEMQIEAFDKPKQWLRLVPVQEQYLYRYRIIQYVPFNNANYNVYKSLPTYLNKVAFLEKMLALHLQGLAAALKWKWNKNEHRLTVTIDDIDRFEKIKEHNNNFIAIDLLFYVNALLPDRIAIGNDMAFGKGWLHKQPRK